MSAKRLSNVRPSVENRYAEAAKAREVELCCPVDYDVRYLKNIPEEVIEKDYGCGDPSQWILPGETVLDLGSGTGKICFIASQIVGPAGRVIGVDMTDDMLQVARRSAPTVARNIGFSNVDFRKGRIQDLALDLEKFDEILSRQPADNLKHWLQAEELANELRVKQPLVHDHSVDVVVSNCVLNLVDAPEKRKMFEEIFRVLKFGGRAVISDIVSDEEVPEYMQNDPVLWSGCISGAMTETAFLNAFREAGFYGIEYVKFEMQPWQTVEGIEFRSITIRAYKGRQGLCREHNQAVIYNGPFQQVWDDDGHRFPRGVRMAVCEKTFRLLQQSPYANSFSFLEPRIPVDPSEAKPFDCKPHTVRHPHQTKGQDYDATTEASTCCESDGK